MAPNERQLGNFNSAVCSSYLLVLVCLPLFIYVLQCGRYNISHLSIAFVNPRFLCFSSPSDSVLSKKW